MVVSLSKIHIIRMKDLMDAMEERYVLVNVFQELTDLVHCGWMWLGNIRITWQRKSKSKYVQISISKAVKWMYESLSSQYQCYKGKHVSGLWDNRKQKKQLFVMVDFTRMLHPQMFDYSVWEDKSTFRSPVDLHVQHAESHTRHHLVQIIGLKILKQRLIEETLKYLPNNRYQTDWPVVTCRWLRLVPGTLKNRNMRQFPGWGKYRQKKQSVNCEADLDTVDNWANLRVIKSQSLPRFPDEYLIMIIIKEWR